MIAEKAKRQFLERKLRSFDFVKKYKQADIDEALATLKPKPTIKFNGSELWLHQKVSFLLMLELKRFLLFPDMGLGKSLSVLALINHRIARGEKPRAVVFVPYIASVETWIEEVRTHCPSLHCLPLLGSTKENREALTTDVSADLVVICYQSAVAMCSKRTKDGWNFTAQEIRELFAGYDMLVMDECHRIKRKGSLTWRMCNAISGCVEWAFGLTGTPFGSDPADLWAQFFVIDKGETLGTTLGMFRAVFYDEKINYWGGYEYKFRPKLLGTLKRMVKHSSIRYMIDECYDMPPRRYIRHEINLPADAKAYYKVALAKLNEAVKNKKMDSGERYREAQAAYMQIRQLSSGFMTLNGGDEIKVQVEFDDKPKLQYLLELVHGISEQNKLIVFHNFIYTNKMICEALKAEGVNHASIWGGTRDKIGQLRKFKTEPTCRVLVINTRSGSSSLNLQMANYVVFFEQPDSPIDREQAERRAWRPGQNKPVFIYDLIVKPTYDDQMFYSNKHGRDLLRDILDGKELA